MRQSLLMYFRPTPPPPASATDDLIESVPDGMMLIGIDGTVIRANSAARRLFVKDGSEVRGLDVRSLVMRPDRETLEERLTEARSAMVTAFDVTVKCNGHVSIVSLTAAPHALGSGSTGVVVTARDVTAERDARHRLAQSESRYRNLFEAASDAIMTFDSLGRFTTVNGAAEQISGYAHEELIGRFFGPLLAVEAMPRALIEFRRALSGAAGQFETVMLHKNGERRHLTVNYACPQRSREVICMIRDATTEKQLQQQLIQSEKMAAIGQLVSGVAHEINNPLASISAFAQLLLADSTLSEEQKHSADVMRGEAKRASRIVHNLLTFARQHKAEKVVADVNSVVDDTLELRTYELNVRGIQVVRDLEEGDAPITMVDVHQLQQVLLNLITNAEQSMCGGDDTRHRLTVRTRGTADVVRLEVEDTGPGIPATAMHQLFVPFFTTKPTGKGTGLGLSISLGIVAEHGGRIWAENLPAGGARFTVELPRITGGARPAMSLVRPAPVPQPESLRILVADDEDGLRLALDRFLSAQGHAVVAVGSGSEAMWRAEGDEQFDVVLLDLRMPDVSGQEVFERWCRDYPHLSDRVTFITGDIVSPELQEFLQSSGRPYIAKPFDFADVVEVLPAQRVA